MDSDSIFSVKSEFTLREAAMALAGVLSWDEDTDKEASAKCRWILDALVRSAKIGEIDNTIRHYVGACKDGKPTCIIVAHSATSDEEREKVEIKRASLMEWCKKREIYPTFLFSNAPVVEKPLHANERNALLAIIRALAELHGIKRNEGAYRTESQSLLTAFSKKQIAEPCNEKTLAKHLSSAFNAW